MKHMIPNVSDIDNIWNWSRVWQYVFVLCSACNYETWLGESRLTASDFNKGKYLDLIKLKVYQPCVQSCAWNQRRKKRTFTTFTNLGYKSFGKKFLRKNFHEKANNLFGKHSVEKFPWKKKKNFSELKLFQAHLQRHFYEKDHLFQSLFQFFFRAPRTILNGSFLYFQLLNDGANRNRLL